MLYPRAVLEMIAVIARELVLVGVSEPPKNGPIDDSGQRSGVGPEVRPEDDARQLDDANDHVTATI